MPLDDVLIDSCFEETDIFGTNLRVGYNPVIKSLSYISDKYSESVGNEDNSEETSIPSMIAHFISYIDAIKNNKKEPVKEWRGMLAAIALQKYFSLDINVESIDLAGNNATDLQKALKEELVDNADRTGCPDDLDKFYYFTKDEKAFAAYLPRVGLCPFSEYPDDLFNDLSFYDSEEKSWKDLADVLDENCKEKLAKWIEELKKQCIREPNARTMASYLSLFIDFKNDISENDVVAAAADFTPIEYHVDDFSPTDDTKIHEVFRNVCSLPENAPKNILSDKMLAILIKENAVEGDKFEIPQDKNNFVPVKMGEEGKHYYVIPPVHEDVINCIKAHDATLENYTFVEHKNPKNEFDGIWFNVTLKLKGDVKICSKRLFNSENIYLTNNMPYMLSFPNIANEDPNYDWKENYIALCKTNNVGVTTYKPPIFFKDGNTLLNKLPSINMLGDVDLANDAGKIDIIPSTAPAGIERYKCRSKAYDNTEFTMIKSESRPYALKFSSSKGESLGVWTIVPRRTYKSLGTTKRLCMDFGTTSTNVRIADTAGNSYKLKSPKEYTETIYNDLGTDKNGLYRKYLFFSNDDGNVGKIFTYAQNFDAWDINNNPVSGTISNVTGKVMILDNDVILKGVRTDSGIYGGLKYFTGMQTDSNIRQASYNFINNFLTLGILQAKEEGASTVELRVSYPSKNSRENIRTTLSEILTDLKAKSSLKINDYYITEASAAGAYYAKVAATEGIVSPVAGYAIVDIGGGTTDISYQKATPGDSNNPTTRMESSAEFAGKNLMRETLCNTNNINNPIEIFNATADRSLINNAQEAYNQVKANFTIAAEQKERHGIILDYLLEKTSINNGRINAPELDVLASDIVLKYYGLFYLISRRIKAGVDAGAIADAPFTICMAGCGSRGFKLCKDILKCRFSDPNKFTDNMKKIIASAFNDTDASGIKIIPGLTNDKSEVVEGLALANIGAGGDGGAGGHDGAGGFDGDVIQDSQKTQESYNNLIKKLKEIDITSFDKSNNKKHFDPEDPQYNKNNYINAQNAALSVWLAADVDNSIQYDYLALLIFNKMLNM